MNTHKTNILTLFRFYSNIYIFVFWTYRPILIIYLLKSHKITAKMKTQHKHRQSNIEDRWAAMSGPFDLSGRLIEQQTEGISLKSSTNDLLLNWKKLINQKELTSQFSFSSWPAFFSLRFFLLNFLCSFLCCISCSSFVISSYNSSNWVMPRLHSTDFC